MTTHIRRSLATICLLWAMAPFAVAQEPAVSRQEPGGASAPKLVVMVVVDQLRADFISRHEKAFTSGINRLLKEGASFDRAAYPYLNTVTCAGHSTIGTGAFPYRHGMILNAWFDRAVQASAECTLDPSVKEISYNGLTGSGDSGRQILVPTLADHLRQQRNGRVVSLSLKARSAIGMAGHGADAIVWFDDRGGWATSTAFSPAAVPFVQQFVDANPITADYGKTWERLLEEAVYQHADDREGERPPTGWTRTFPHRLGTPEGKPDRAFYTQWARSPLADEYLARMAMHAVEALDLGRGQGIDFLGVSFSTLDMVGHGFGPESHEVQDIVFRLDRTLGRLMDHLDAKVGRGNYVLGLSADHGVGPVPEQVTGGGRQSSAEIRSAIDGALTPIFGPAPTPAPRPGAPATATPPRASYVVYTAYTDLYLAPGVMDRLKRDEKAMAAVSAALKALPGIEHAFRADDLDDPAARTSSDPVRRAAALSYHAGRSGDLVVVPRELWLLSTAATTHGTLHTYDQRVPVMLFGAGVKPGRYTRTATPADIAPTLAALAHFTFSNTDGQILAEAVAPQTAAK
jgi:predicted AlkP superfamily pyrophosphatase or phosphodiesterase